MTKEIFNDAIKNQNLEELDLFELETFANEYPYFQVVSSILEQRNVQNHHDKIKHTLYHGNAESEAKSPDNINQENNSIPVNMDENSPKLTSSKNTENDHLSHSSNLSKEDNYLNVKDILYSSQASVQPSEFGFMGLNITPENTNSSVQEPNASFDGNLDSSKHTDEKGIIQYRRFSKWMSFLKNKKMEEESDRQKIAKLKAEWQKQKLKEMNDEEDDPINDEVFDMVINSVTEQEDIASETLAKLYSNQGLTQKAIGVYEKLILKFPEKSSYFVALINQLKNS